jgi:hypothetical protein
MNNVPAMKRLLSALLSHAYLFNGAQSVRKTAELHATLDSQTEVLKTT